MFRNMNFFIRTSELRINTEKITFARHNLKTQGITYVNEVIQYVHYSWVVHIYTTLYVYIYAVYIMIQCTEPTTPVVIAYSELPVSLQEAILGLKTQSPITVLSERGEGFFLQL